MKKTPENLSVESPISHHSTIKNVAHLKTKRAYFRRKKSFKRLSSYLLAACLITMGIYFFKPIWVMAQPLPAFEFPNLFDEKSFFKSTDLQGNVSILNVWASWCSACASEHALLVQQSKAKRVKIYGIDFKDAPELARQYLHRAGNPYQQIGEDEQGIFVEKMQINAIPQTFLIDKKGIIRYQYSGVIDQSVWDTQIQPRLNLYNAEPK